MVYYTRGLRGSVQKLVFEAILYCSTQIIRVAYGQQMWHSNNISYPFLILSIPIIQGPATWVRTPKFKYPRCEPPAMRFTKTNISNYLTTYSLLPPKGINKHLNRYQSLCRFCFENKESFLFVQRIQSLVGSTFLPIDFNYMSIICVQ